MAKTFELKMSRLAQKLALGIDDVVKTVALEIHRQVVLSTPVDTGEARSNWLLNVGGPATTLIGPYTEYPKHSTPNPGIGERANATAAIQQGLDAIRAHKSGQSIYISNNADHINEINRSGTIEAGPRFIELGIRKARSILKSSRILG